MTWDVIATRSVEFFTFEYAFATRALLASVLIGALCGLVGTFMVLRRMSLIGDAAGHATLPGVVGAFLVTGSKSMAPLLVGGLGSALLATWVVERVARGRRTRPDAAIAIGLAVFFGLGLVLLSVAQRSPTAAQAGLDGVLFGNAAAVTGPQLAMLAVISLALAAGVIALVRPLSLATFDPSFARAAGVPVDLVRAGVTLALTLAVVVSIHAVGVVLVAAMLITPPSTALLVTRRLPAALALSAGIGAGSGAAGAWVSFVFDGVSTGPAMVLVASAAFAIAWMGAADSPLRSFRRTAEVSS